MSKKPTHEEWKQQVTKLTRDLQRAENFLHESEYKYNALLNEIEDGYAEGDFNRNITFVNRSLAKMLGYSPEEFSSLDLRDVLAEEYLETIYDVYSNVQTTGKPDKGVIHEIRGKDGSMRVLENSVSLKINSDGTPIGFRCIVRDITERKRAEEQIANQRRHLETIFGSVKDAIITVNLEMKVIAANKTVERLCGISNKEMIGKELGAGMKPCSGACFEVLRKPLTGRRSVQEYRIECGHERCAQQVVNITVSPLVGQDESTLGAVFVIRDMTRLSDLERELNERHQFHRIVGKSRKMQDIYGLLENLADFETTVLITGESGVGKEVVAQALHHSGSRKDNPLIKVNCSALAENLLESELFGHVKGAFTGAVRDMQGRFQAADRGSILLDEIGEISPRIQLKLLRVLEEKEFERVGEATPIKVDVRVIACTNRDLKEKVRRGEFREDLYYRLKVMEIPLPPLRERLEDIPLLVDHFRSRFNLLYKRRIEGVSEEVLGCFMDYPWPGNVRELEHTIERAFVLCRDRTIRLEHIALDIKQYTEAESSVGRKKPADEPQCILEALNQAGWNKAKAARMLGIGRMALYRRIAKYDLTEPAE